MKIIKRYLLENELKEIKAKFEIKKNSDTHTNDAYTFMTTKGIKIEAPKKMYRIFKNYSLYIYYVTVLRGQNNYILTNVREKEIKPAIIEELKKIIIKYKELRRDQEENRKKRNKFNEENKELIEKSKILHNKYNKLKKIIKNMEIDMSPDEGFYNTTTNRRETYFRDIPDSEIDKLNNYRNELKNIEEKYKQLDDEIRKKEEEKLNLKEIKYLTDYEIDLLSDVSGMNYYEEDIDEIWKDVEYKIRFPKIKIKFVMT